VDGGRGAAIHEIVQGITANPLDLLGEDPLRRVKFLMKKERDDLAAIFEYGDECQWLPLSLLRSKLFHSTQISVARADPKSRAGRVEEGPTSNYVAQQVLYKESTKHLQRVSLAAVHVLRKERRGEDGVVEDMQRWREASDAFDEFNRAGLESDAPESPEVRDAFCFALDPLRMIQECLTRFSKQLENMPDWKVRWEQDKVVFATQFKSLYPGADDSGEEDRND
jgi:hypothetical protein